MAKRVDPLDTGTSPTQVRVDYLTVNRELLGALLAILLARSANEGEDPGYLAVAHQLARECL